MKARPQAIEAANRLDEQMLHDGTHTKDLALAELMQWFGFMRQTAEVRAEIDAALRATGMTTMPPLHQLNRRDDRIRITRSVRKIVDPEAKRALSELVHLSIWRRGTDYQMLERDRVVDQDPIILRGQLTWFHIDLRPGQPTVDPAGLYDFLAERCPGLSMEVIEDLLDPDDVAGSNRHGIDNQVRVVSIPEMIVETDPDRIRQVASASDSSEQSQCGVLRRRMTEIAAGEKWVLTVWHPPTWHGKGIDRENAFVWDDPIGPDPQYPAVVELVSRRWEVAEEAASGHDLALMVLVVIANGHSEARRAMYGWLDGWDAEFYLADARSRHRASPSRIERATLLDLRQLVTLLRTDAISLNSPDAGVENAWFPGRLADAEQFNAMMDRTVGDLRDLSDAIRTSFDLLATAGMEQSIRLAENQGAQAETLNRLIQTVGFLLLGPSLVAALLTVESGALTDGGRIVTSMLVFILGVLLTIVLVLASRSGLKHLLDRIPGLSLRSPPGDPDDRENTA